MNKADTDPFADIQSATRRHLKEHGCGAYTFEDGLGLIRLAQQHQAKRILELGTALGYTACCLAYGSQLAQVDTIEGDIRHVELAEAQIAQHNLSSRISVHHGNFEVVLNTLLPGYDLAFFDGFAPALTTILHLRELLTEGGLLVCSNLQLGSGDEAKQLASEFVNSNHWERRDPIEHGRTAVLIKQNDTIAT